MIYSIYNLPKFKVSVSDISYTYLTKTELVFIEEYHELGHTGRKIAKKLKRGHEIIYRISDN